MKLGRFSRRAWKRSILFAVVFAVVFSLVAIARVIFVQNQTNRDVIADLKQTADDVSNQIYPGHWDPVGYRQSTSQDQDYLILTSNGLLVDFEGFVPGLIAQAKPVDESITEKPTLINTEIGDTWLVASRKVKGGSVVAGISNRAELKDPESILRTSLSAFGETINEAIKVKPRAINQQVDYAILGELDDLRDVQTGFPLKIKLALPDGYKIGTPYQKVLGGTPYILYTKPITDRSGATVGTVLAFLDISGQLQVLSEQKRFDFLVCFAAWLITAVGAAVYNIVDEWKRRNQEVSLEEALKTGENQTVEFKEGIDAPGKDRDLARTMVAFANTNAGNIFIGIADAGEVFGVQASTTKELDKVQKRIREIAVQLVKPPIRVRVTCFNYQEKKVLRVFVPRGIAPVYFADSVPYIRDVTSVSKAGPEDLPMIFRGFARMGA